MGASRRGWLEEAVGGELAVGAFSITEPPLEAPTPHRTWRRWWRWQPRGHGGQRKKYHLVETSSKQGRVGGRKGRKVSSKSLWVASTNAALAPRATNAKAGPVLI